MDTNTLDRKSASNTSNDRVMPRWQTNSIASFLLSGEQWHDVPVIDISLGGIKVHGRWDHGQPVTAVGLTDDGPSVTGAFLILQADIVWVDQAQGTTALRFDIPNRTVAASLLKFLSSHLANAP